MLELEVEDESRDSDAGSVSDVSTLEIAHFKEVVGHFATGVVVVTTSNVEGPAGFTCQTFGSLSLDPLLISFAAAHVGNSWGQFRGVGAVGVNILSADQETVARVFATSGVDKFAGIGWSAGPGGSPLLHGALAHMEGEIVSTVTHGDHDLVVVQVEYGAAHGGRPLVYYRGGFGPPA